MPQENALPLSAAISRAYFLAVSGRASVARALEEAQALYDREVAQAE
ncbi:MAG: hypothetical protein H5T86_04425 [Armatimonadetes bacterium]|nr:hypothetical protein [Armatimonadota bacterium]